MFVGIAGSRDFPDLALVASVIDTLDADDIIVSGGARGVDRAAETRAIDVHLPVVSFRPLNLVVEHPGWCIERILLDFDGVQSRTQLPERYPGFAPAAFVRNGYIVELAEKMLLFWDGHSSGTKDTLRKAQAKGIPVDLIRDDSLWRR